jgi:hypothetical protein
MDSFDLDRLDAVALEQTIAYLRANPEPRSEDIAFADGMPYTAMLDDAVEGKDWLGDDASQEMEGIDMQIEKNDDESR